MMSARVSLLILGVSCHLTIYSIALLADISQGCRCSVVSTDGYNLEWYRKTIPLPEHLPSPTCDELRQLCSQLCSDHLTETFDSHEGRHLAGTYKDLWAGVFFCQRHNPNVSTYTRSELSSVSWVKGCPLAEHTIWKRSLCCGRELLPGYRHQCPVARSDCKIPTGNVGTIVGWYADCDKNNFFAHV